MAPSPIPAVALTGLYLGLGMVADVLAKRSADIVGFLELTFVVPSDVSLIGAGIDQLAFGHDPLHQMRTITPEESVGSSPAHEPS